MSLFVIMTRVAILRGVSIAVGLLLCLHPMAARAESNALAKQGILEQYTARLPSISAQIPGIIVAAEAAATRRLAHTNSLIVATHRDSVGFANELMSRAGGLAEVIGERGKGESTNDIVLTAVRSWEGDGARMIPVLNKHHAMGRMVILFASKAGMPTNIPVDHIIDNGADSGSAAQAPLNAIVNVANSWIWVCEYVAALSRNGKQARILKSAYYPDGRDFNTVLREDRGNFPETTVNFPAGQLAGLYFQRLEQVAGDLGAPAIRDSIGKAAEIAADRIRGGRKVFSSTCNHLIKEEVNLDLKSPLKPFRPYNGGFAANLKKGDLLIWMGYIGMSTAGRHQDEEIRATGADLIACYVPDPDPSRNASNALVQITQPWVIGDAEIALPFPPGKMAPVSGVIQGLEYRMIDEALAAALQRFKQAGIKIVP